MRAQVFHLHNKEVDVSTLGITYLTGAAPSPDQMRLTVAEGANTHPLSYVHMTPEEARQYALEILRVLDSNAR